MSKIVLLAGNGLSVALSSEFSMPNITRKFFEHLGEEHRRFIEHHMMDKLNLVDFEECIAIIEKLYDALHFHQSFYTNGITGEKVLSANNLNIIELLKHENSIRESIHTYMAIILNIVNWNVKKHSIDSRLKDFVKWLDSIIKEQNQVELFTLNYDLLLESILIDLAPHKFLEYYHQAGQWFSVNKAVSRYYFNPDKVKKQRHKQECNTRLYHLHGSVSSFKDLKNKKIFKVKNDVIKKHDIYHRISELMIVPSIITGGRKTDKIKETPFDFYYDQFVRMMNDRTDLCEELIIVGYSFRDEHINSAIAKRMHLAYSIDECSPLKILIVDYAMSDEGKENFINQVNFALGLGEDSENRFQLNDPRISFEGANSILRYYL
ncbi:SIR2 family protein [Paenibacillus typhae]|uniref:SIR2 family protein n=1 Tax=Paenibacillus typhae TaxID=1174501 RepID=UPI001C8F0F4A|nr:SIR2 family protein [Paenibacillus typhae]MBY0009646.1 SIR2 family protein [Paenibacillus typhae]